MHIKFAIGRDHAKSLLSFFHDAVADSNDNARVRAVSITAHAVRSAVERQLKWQNDKPVAVHLELDREQLNELTDLLYEIRMVARKGNTQWAKDLTKASEAIIWGLAPVRDRQYRSKNERY
jgi:hypothetical protein